MTLPNDVALEVARAKFPTDDAYKVALFINDLTVVSAVNFALADAGATEVDDAADGYSTGGFTLSFGAFSGSFQGFWGQVGTTAIYDPADTISQTGSTFTFRSLLIYNDTNASDLGLYFFNAGSDQIVSNGQLTIVWPVADAVTGLVRLPQ